MRENEELFAHLSLGQVFSRSINVFVDRFDVFMTLSAVVLVPAAIFGAVVGLTFGMEAIMIAKMHPEETEEEQAMDMIQFLVNHTFAVAAVFLINIIVSTLTTLVGEGAMVRASADTYAAQPQGWWTCAKLGFQHFCALWGAGCIVGGIIYGGMLFVGLLFVQAARSNSGFLAFLAFAGMITYGVALVYYISSVMLIFPVIIIENKGPMNAIRRSFEVSEGRRCYIFCAIFVLWVVKLIVAQLLHNIFNGDNPLAAILSPAGIIVSFIPDLIYLPLNSILKTVLYTSIRVDKEGLTQAVLQRELVEVESIYSPPNTDYRQVSLMDESKDTVANGLVSDFA